MKKSYFDVFILTVLLGPIGLFYSSLAAAVGFTVFAIGIGLTAPFLLIIVWPMTVIAGFSTVRSHNKKVVLEANRHLELLAAVRQGISQSSIDPVAANHRRVEPQF